jgi:hypothetical protein
MYYDIKVGSGVFACLYFFVLAIAYSPIVSVL